MIELRIDHRAWEALERRLRQAGDQAHHAIRRGVNKTGDKARTQVVRTLAKAAGVKQGEVRRALSVKRANFGSLAYVITIKGPALSLKRFGARQAKPGVSAAPWAQRRIFPHTFGPRIAKLGGHVYVRATNKRLPIVKLWGPALANELVRDPTAAAFNTTVARELPRDIGRELEAILTGRAPRGG